MSFTTPNNLKQPPPSKIIKPIKKEKENKKSKSLLA
jgi:hypothetical protein